MKTILILIMLLWLPNTAFADSIAPLRVRGELVMWSRSTCFQNTLCELPKPTGEKFFVDVEISGTKPGPYMFVYPSKLGRLEFLLIWREDSIPYLVAQTRFFSLSGDILFECSRYDGLESAIPFPVGACGGGQVDGIQHGLTFTRLIN